MDIAIRRIAPTDAEDIARLANDYDIARMTASLPHPYTRENAREWLTALECRPHEHVFAVCGGETFLGVVGLTCKPELGRAELGYWLGKPYWGRGVATAAAGLAIDYAFDKLNLRKVFGFCFGVNAASRRVMEKNGMQPEGCLRQHFERFGQVHDLLCFGLLREEYLERKHHYANG
jgi:RimJ/RimL family protein N-acetyltransferase